MEIFKTANFREITLFTDNLYQLAVPSYLPKTHFGRHFIINEAIT